MNMQKNRCSFFSIVKNEKKSNAFTYIEVIVALVVISLIAGLLYFSYSICIKSFTSSRESVREAVERLNTDAFLRKKIQSVSIPYWEKDFDFSFSEAQITLPWLEGIKAEQSVIMPENASIKDVTPIKSDKGKPKGLHIKYYIKNNEYVVKVLFASRFYGEVEL